MDSMFSLDSNKRNQLAKRCAMTIGMGLILCCVFGLRPTLYPLVAIISIISALIWCYKISGSTSEIVNLRIRSNQQRNQQSILSHNYLRQSSFRDRIKSIVMKRLDQFEGRARSYSSENLMASRSMNCNFSMASLATLSLVFILVLTTSQSTLSLEEDAQIMTPVANLAKSIIKTVTLGVPLEVNVDTTGVVKNFAYFTWRTGFPVSMPSGFFQKAQDFYNRVKMRVDQAKISDVERKSLANLKGDLDEIVDGIVERVRISPDGLYTDYLQARVGNTSLPLEDACTLVGIQLRAYGVDLTNYRDIAGAVLGIPVVPTVASAVMNVASIGQSGFDIMQNLTSTALVRPLNATTAILLSRMPLTLPMGNMLTDRQMVPFGTLLFGQRPPIN